MFRPREILLSLALSSLAIAQGINVLSGAPSCAQSCSQLSGVAKTCASQGGTASKVAYCFCTNSAISTFGSNPALCSSSCSTSSDQTDAGQWFARYCANPATIVGAAAPAATTAAEASTTTAGVPAATTASGASSTSSVGGSTATDTSEYNSSQDETGSWWHNHGKWIVMVIVLVVVFAVIIAVGIIWKKRYNKKHNRGDQLPPGTHWGPAQHHQYPNGGPSLNAAAVDPEKGPSSIRQNGMQRMESDFSRQQSLRQSSTRDTKTKRLKKLVGR